MPSAAASGKVGLLPERAVRLPFVFSLGSISDYAGADLKSLSEADMVGVGFVWSRNEYQHLEDQSPPHVSQKTRDMGHPALADWTVDKDERISGSWVVVKICETKRAAKIERAVTLVML
jgi:hypothetical protein